MFVARNLSVPLLADIPAPAPAPAPAHGAKTVLRVMFASRIARTKNLAFALKCLQLARTNVCLTVIGPTEDIAYWAECQALMKALPSQVSVVYLGGMPPHTLAQELPKHDVFFLPTLGENFGHALVEAWQAGLSVLTSDQTPWRNLHTKRLGWDLPLGNPQSFADALAEVAGWCPEERQARREHCAEFGREVVRDEAAIDANRRLFLAAVRGKEAWRGLRF